VLRSDKDLVERRATEALSAARSRERNERSSVVALGESPNGLVNCGGAWSPSEDTDMSEGFERALVGREDLRKV
jgi:hypothetical protein